MNNHQGSKASADQRVMSTIARTLKDINKFFVDSRTTVETIGETTMEIFDKTVESLTKAIQRLEYGLLPSVINSWQSTTM